MKKRIFSILLALCMVLTFMPTVAMADTKPNFNDGTWEALEVDTDGTIKTTIKAGGHYYLDADLTISRTLTISVGKDNPVILDLNGHVLKYYNASGTKGSVIKVGEGGNLTLQDSNTENLSHKFDTTNALWVLAADEATGENIETVYGGVITGGTGTEDVHYCGGGIYVVGNDSRTRNARFTMTGGNIVGCTADNGGGLSTNFSYITIQNGCIEGCTATNGGGGGGVYVWEGNLTMNDGTIKYCEATSPDGEGAGGGVCVVYNMSFAGEFNMIGGEISNCVSDLGGGVYLHHGLCVFNMTGGTIKDCTSPYDNNLSGGVYIMGESNCKMNADGGVIEDNVYVNSNGKITCSENANGTTFKGEVTNNGSISIGTFYGTVTNGGTISGGTFYGGITGTGTGTISESATKYEVSFDLNGGSGTAPVTQVFVNTNSSAKVKNPTDPTRAGYNFLGWFDGDTEYSFNEGVTSTITLKAKWQSKYDYKVKFDTNGGTAMSEVSINYDESLPKVDTPAREGYEFIAWKYNNTEISASETATKTYADLAGSDTVTSITLTAQWKDTTPPTGEIKLGNDSWKTLLTDVNFSTLFKDNQNVTITASDNSGEAVTISYLLSDEALSEAELATANFTTYSSALTISSEGKHVVYAKLTDSTGNIAYISSDGFVIDKTAPTFDGLQDGESYRGDVTFTVSDNVAVKSVSVQSGNKTENLTADADGKYTLKSSIGKVTVTATDEAGNSNAIIVTVNGNSSSLPIVQKPTISLGGADVKTETAADGSTVYTTAEGKLVLSSDGTTASIIPNDGYEAANVSVNGIDKAAVTTLTGLKTGDKIIVTFKQTAETQPKAELAQIKSMVEKMSLTARSSKTAKKNIKVTLKTDDETTAAIKEIKSLGYTVKYKYYRSTKKASKYAAKVTKTSKTYTNTNGKSGTRYYYKVQVRAYDENGKCVAKTALKQCKYATRIWMK